MVMRIGGMASGFDTESMIKQIMQTERLPLDKLTQRKQVLEWQRDSYRQMNTLLTDLRRASLSFASGSNLSAKSVSSSDESKLAVTASSSAGNSTYTITNATLAKSAHITSTLSSVDPSATLSSNASLDTLWKTTFDQTIEVTTSGDNFKLANKNINGDKPIMISVAGVNGGSPLTVTHDSNEVLTSSKVYVNKDTGELKFGTSIAAGSKIEATYEFFNRQKFTTTTAGQTEFELSKIDLADVSGYDNNGTLGSVISVKSKDADGNEVVKNYNIVSTFSSGNQAIFNKDTGKLTFNGESIAEGSSFEVAYSAKNIQFSITSFDTSGKEVFRRMTVEGKDTLNSVVTKINNSNVGVTALYEKTATDGNFSMTRKETGIYNPTSDSNIPEGREMIFEGQFLTDFLNLDSGIYVTGSNAQVTMNGVTITRQSNSFSVDGVNFTLKDNITTPISVGVTTDKTKVVENIKNFVGKYNEIVSKINDTISESRYRDFPPLTKEQRKDMTEQEVKLWDEKAKSGMLRGDSILRSTLTQLRSDMAMPVETGGQYTMLAQIGISTTSNYYDQKLEIDEIKLNQALEKDPESVQKLFNLDLSDGTKGVASRLQNNVNVSIEKIEAKAGNQYRTPYQYSIGKDLIEIEKRVTSFEQRLAQIESRYWSQFTAMEKALDRANSQGASLTQMFNGAQ